MAREKGANRKEKKILIRTNKEGKMKAERQSKAKGMNTSEYIRDLIDKDGLISGPFKEINDKLDKLLARR